MSNERKKKMKRFLYLALVIAVFTVSAPLIALPDSDGPLIEIKNETDAATKQNEETTIKTEEKEKTVRVFSTSDSTVSTVSERDYIIGCVAAEMPVTYDEEALKAQAVACRTFLQWKRNQGEDKSLNGADISDSSRHQAFMTKEQMQAKWGKSFGKYYKKLEKAVDSVSDKLITYENEPIMAVFHALSPGSTEDAKTVWGYDVPYLKSVSSEGDRLSPSFSVTLVLSDSEFNKLMSSLDGFSPSEDSDKYIGNIERSKAGTVTKITVCGRDYTGMQIKDALSLKSAAFTVSHTDGSFVFSVNGYGHFVGMSQYGADYMAKQGFKYDEILKHYYTGVEIE